MSPGFQITTQQVSLHRRPERPGRCLVGIDIRQKQVLITSVSSSIHTYLQFTFDFMTLTRALTSVVFNKKIYFLSASLDNRGLKEALKKGKCSDSLHY